MEIQKERFRMVAKTFAGLEKVLAQEIEDLGGEEIKIVQRAVEFTGDDALMYRANYLCRSAIRILKPIAEFFAPNENVLYEEVKKIPWETYLNLHSTFSVDGGLPWSTLISLATARRWQSIDP